MSENVEERTKKILRLRQEITKLREKNLLLYSRIDEMDNWFADSWDAINDVLGYTSEYDSETNETYNSNYYSDVYSETPEDSEDGQFVEESEDEEYKPNKNNLKTKLQNLQNPNSQQAPKKTYHLQVPIPIPVVSSQNSNQNLKTIAISPAMTNISPSQQLSPQQILLMNQQLKQQQQFPQQVRNTQNILNDRITLMIDQNRRDLVSYGNTNQMPSAAFSYPQKTKQSENISDIATKVLIQGFGYKLDPKTNQIVKVNQTSQNEYPLTNSNKPKMNEYILTNSDKPRPSKVTNPNDNIKSLAIQKNIKKTLDEATREKLYSPNIVPGKQLPPPPPDIIARYKEMRQFIQNDPVIKQEIAKFTAK